MSMVEKYDERGGGCRGRKFRWRAWAKWVRSRLRGRDAGWLGIEEDEHIPAERMREVVSNCDAFLTDAEEQHLRHCWDCLRAFIALVLERTTGFGETDRFPTTEPMEHGGTRTMGNPEIDNMDWTTVFLILALILIALPFAVPVIIWIRAALSRCAG